MKPAPFRYERPKDIASVLALLSGSEGGAAILAGGQSLVAAMGRRQRTPAVVIDINHIADLEGLMLEADGALRIGACMRLEDVRRHPAVQARQPLIAGALAFVANPVVRRRGTLVGNLVNNGRGCEMAAVALVLDAMFEVLRPGRPLDRIPAAHFLAGPLPVDGFVTHVVFPERTPGSRGAFAEVARRPSHVCVLGAAVETGASQTAVALAGYGRTALRCKRTQSEAHALLQRGLLPAPDMLRASLAADGAGQATGDNLADADYRIDVAPVVVCDALRRAVGDAA